VTGSEKKEALVATKTKVKGPNPTPNYVGKYHLFCFPLVLSYIYILLLLTD
jgi:hypothetical protein